MGRIISRLKARLAMAASRESDNVEIFSRIYRKKVWSTGDARGRDFWSGAGSTGAFTREYEQAVVRFIRQHQINMIVDLGCGDFQVGQRILAEADCSYIGVDVVPDLIARNNRLFGNDRVAFICADISLEELPDGDLCLIRQVLQHLDNATVEQVLKNVAKYPWVIITESQRIRPKVVNRDIKTGSWTRTQFDSGLYFDQPPFSREIETLLDVSRDQDVVIRTCLLRN